MKMRPRRSRRATVLLMVVSLLALLFLIVTGFLSLARVDRGMVVDLRRADLAEAIAEDTDALAMSLIKDQLLNDAGRVLGGGDPRSYSNEDVFGYRKSNWLAPSEPVWDAAVNFSDPRVALPALPGWQALQQIRWPGVTSLDGSVTLPQPFALWELMRDYNFNLPAFGGPTGREDVQWNARNPFMDADGDGVPDSHFLLVRMATELANAAAGRSVHLPRYDANPMNLARFLTYAIPEPGMPGFNYEKWQRFDEQARYEVALRIISHGGMVTLDSPTLYTPGNVPVAPLNRDFTVDLFDATRDPRDPAMNALYGAPIDENRLFDELHANTQALERPLRRRYFLPPAAELDQYNHTVRRVPPILGELQGEFGSGFPYTFLPSLGGVQPVGDPQNYQRINLGAEDGFAADRLRWAQCVSLDPTWYNQGDPTARQLLWQYDNRHTITTANYSDDLTRRQSGDEPDLEGTHRFDFGTYPGELKFYLGEVAKAYVEVGGAGSGQYVYDYRRGAVIVQRLARVFYDMLESHDATNDWGSVFNADAINSGDPEQVVSRRQQAFMLAVNLVAFAAPRDIERSTRGWIDVVSYIDVDAPGAATPEYVGYAPQPFFSEAIAYNDSDPEEPPGEEEDHVAIAVELYNPNDLTPGFQENDPDGDVFALYLPQFAIAVNGANPNAGVAGSNWQVLDSASIVGLPTRMSGRSFLTFVIRDISPDGTDHFNNYVGNRVLPLNITDPGAGNRVKLDLWRQGRYYDSATGNGYFRWFHVDRIEVFYPDRGDWASRYRDVAQAIHPTLPDPVLSRQPYFGVVRGVGASGNPVNRAARWSMVCAWDDDDTSENGGGFPHNEGGPAMGEPAAIALTSALGALDQGAPAQFERNGQNLERLQPTLPIMPLMTMNAGPVGLPGPSGSLYEPLTNLPMFGALDTYQNPIDPRPRSFPTVGFMLFVPRYSHVHQVMLSPGQVFPASPAIMRTRTMSQTLEKERWRKGYKGNQPWTIPADFGHMPIFDNTQKVKSDSYLDEVGEIPWGLLVFDYFTTIDPQRDANGDGQPDVDPLRIPGRININAAPWYVLANLPMLGPDSNFELPIRAGTSGGSGVPADPSPAFWDPDVAVLSGVVVDPVTLTVLHHRLLATDPAYNHNSFDVPWARNLADLNSGRYRLGPWLAQAAAAYRDGVQYVRYTPLSDLFSVYADSHLRSANGALYGYGATVYSVPYRPTVYGTNGGIRGAAASGTTRPEQYGFVTVGELLNVKGFDSSRHNELPTALGGAAQYTALGRGDFVKAVSLLVLLDSQYLTTRSNTFTVYASVMDRENPRASVRSQTTVDRSNVLPRLTYAYSTYSTIAGLIVPVDPANPLNPANSDYPLAPLLLNIQPDTGNIPETPMVQSNDDAEPQVIARQRVGYFNARYDD